MPNPYGAPEISVKQIDSKRQNGEQFVWLDVREPEEVARVSIQDERVRLLPLSVLADRQLAALPAEAQNQQAEIIVFCHHGLRSAQVAAWLRQQGWQKVMSMTGGVAAWSQEIDPSIGMY
jgi:rhodanese-related sulfurtransferase